MIQATDIKDHEDILEALGIKTAPGLERSEAQALRDILATQLDMYNGYMQYLKSAARHAYQFADKSHEYGNDWFQNLNVTRSKIRQTRAKIAKLVAIQRKLRQLTK